MPISYILDKVLKADAEHRLPETTAYRIERIGTDDTSEAYLEIGGRTTGKIIVDTSPMHQTETNKLGLTKLEDLYYFAPPKEPLIFRGTSGKKCRIVGKAIKYMAGEVPSPEDLARFAQQVRKHIKTFYGSKTLAVDEDWADGRELTVFEITPLTTEKILLDNIAMMKFTNITVAEADVAMIPKIDGNPIIADIKEPPYQGIDAISMPYPPKDTTEEIPFSFKDIPIEVLGDKTLSIIAKNVSGATISPTAGTALKVEFRCLARYEKKE